MRDFRQFKGYLWMVYGYRITFLSIGTAFCVANIVDKPQSPIIGMTFAITLPFGFAGVGILLLGLRKLRAQFPELRPAGSRISRATVELFSSVARDVYRLNYWK